MVKAKVWLKVKDFSGSPSLDNLKLVDEELPELKDGDVLFEATFLTVDPYMRLHPTPAGNPMPGEQVAKVVKSRNADYKVGTEWVCFFGWRTHTVFNPSKQFDNLPQIPGFPDLAKVGMPSYYTQKPMVFPIPKLGNFPHSLALGTVGQPGVTVYLGLLEYGTPKAGETVLVNGSAGAVGNVVGQIAKLKGCKVIGYAGRDDKVKWLKVLGFDFAYNYKKVNLSESLKEAAPDGVDVYYDNVGGDFSDTVLSQHMKLFGRAVFIGVISAYNVINPTKGPQLYFPVLMKHLTIHGFQVPVAPRTKWLEALADLNKWVNEGKLKFREHITNGFDKMPEAFFGLFTGENTGKAIVKV